MSDLVQIVEHGYQDDDGTYDWTSGHGGIVPAKVRRMILDRPTTESREDGWCYQHRRIADDTDQCVAVTRIRWCNPVLYTPADIDRLTETWTRLPQEAP